MLSTTNKDAFSADTVDEVVAFNTIITSVHHVHIFFFYKTPDACIFNSRSLFFMWKGHFESFMAGCHIFHKAGLEIVNHLLQ